MTDSATPYQPEAWDLSDLPANAGAEAVDQELSVLETLTREIESHREALTKDIAPGRFVEILDLLERFTTIAQKLNAHPALSFSADTQNQQSLALMGRLEQTLTAMGNRIMFFSLWWRALDQNVAERLIQHGGDRTYYLRKQRLFRDHTLSEPQEKIISIKDVNGVNALCTLYDMITNKFTYTLEIDGETKTMNRESLMALVRHPDPEIRDRVYREQYRVYEAEATVLGQIYVNCAQDWSAENIDLRRFQSPLAVRNLSNDIPDPVVETLLDVCREGAAEFQRFFRLKARRLGVDRLRRVDLYAPISKANPPKIPYDQAVAMVMDGFKGFSAEMMNHAQRVFDQRHIHSELVATKRGGAFCYSVSPDIVPYVLVNYTGEPRQVATLAHELGHAIHSMLAAHHSIFTFHSALPLAETASIFSEMLLTDYLLERQDDTEVRRDMLFETVDNMYATVLRQAYFVLFERDAHRMITRENRTIDELSTHYLASLKEQFGDAIDVEDIFRHEWITIPHIYHTPFYCYAYSFGMLLSLALYDRYRKEGASFVPVLLKILSHGGAAAPADVLTEAGIDMSDPAFWRGGFSVISDFIGRLEQ